MTLPKSYDPRNLTTYSSGHLADFITTFENDFKVCRQELDGLQLSLDQRATEKSPAELYLKMYQARENTNRASIIYNKFLKMQILATKLFSMKSEQRRLALAKVYRDHADEIKNMRSAADRETYCTAYLDIEDEQAYINAKLLLDDAKQYLEYFKAQYFFWKDFQQNLLTQLGTIKVMIQLGQLTGNVLNSMAEDTQLNQMLHNATEPTSQEGIINL